MRELRTTLRDGVRLLRPGWLCLLLLLAAGVEAQATEFKYAGAKKCKSCHGKEPIGNQYASWLDTKHAKAFETLASDKAREWAAEATIRSSPRSALSATSPPTAWLRSASARSSSGKTACSAKGATERV